MLLPNYIKIITFTLTFCSIGGSSYDDFASSLSSTTTNATIDKTNNATATTGGQQPPVVNSGLDATNQQAAGDTNSSESQPNSEASSRRGESSSTISRRDQLVAETSPLVQHSNHQNYPVELYPSATYTTLTTSNQQVAPGSPNSTSQANKLYANQYTGNSNQQQKYNNLQQQQINSLLNKDHHQARPFSDAFADAFINNYGNQAKDSSPFVADNHNYNFGSSSTSNLIQNLTASLFPLQLSNSSLSTLSDLLNKTKYHQQSTQQINGYKPNFNIETYYTNHLSDLSSPYYNSGGTGSSSAQNSLTASDFAQSTYGNLLDYLRIPPPNSFKQHHSQPSTNSYSFKPMHQTTTSTSQQMANGLYGSQHDKVLSSSSYSKTPSNIYNTYIPATTNGQALNVGSFYDQYIDTSGGYKLPLQIDSSSHLPSTKSHQHQTYQTSGSQNHGYQRPNLSQGYQFIQHHNSNNQNHIDKVVYHSTPFRPSIVSPPQSSNGMGGGGVQSGNLVAGARFNGNSASQTLASMQQQQQRPKTEADSKSMAFASMDQYTQTATNGQAINASRHRDHGQKSSYNHVDFDNDHYHSPSSNSSSSLTGNYHQESESKYSNHQTTSNKTSGANSATSGSSSSSFGSAPAILFDLYEREIDNQIRDALYRDAQHHALPLLSNLAQQQVASASSSWMDKVPQSTTTYDDMDTPALNPSASSSWQIGSTKLPPLSVTGSSMSSYLSSGSRPLVSSALQESGAMPLDALSAALQELPTFSASDLQPLMPSGPSYSLLPPSGLHESASSALDSSSVMSAASHLGASTHLLPHLTGTTFGSSSASQVDATEMAAALANLANSAALDTNSLLQAHQSSLLMNHQPTSSSTVNQNHNHNQSPQAAASTQSSTTSLSQPASGLPAILMKLQSGQLSSILTSPFAHLYASLPKYRYGKNKQQQHQQQQQDSHSQQSQSGHITANTQHQQHQLPSNLNYFLSPESLFAAPGSTGAATAATNGHSKIKHTNHLFSLLGQTTGGSSMLDPSYYQPTKLKTTSPSYQQQQQQQQYQQQMATLANLLAAASMSGQPQYGFSGSALEPETLASYFNQQTIQPSVAATPLLAATPTAFDNSGFFGSYAGLTGAGLTPLIYRNVMSPWARKQASSSGTSNAAAAAASSLTSSNLAPLFSSLLNHGSHSSSTGSNHSTSMLARPSLSSLLSGPGGGGVGGGLVSSLFNPLMASASSTSGTSATTGGGQFAPPKPKIKIKILRIPVAVYDQSTSTGGLTGSGSVSMMPSQMQPSLTASLLASMPCPMAHNQATYVPHQFDQHLAAVSGSGLASAGISSPSSTLAPLGPYTPATSPLAHSNDSSNIMISGGNIASHFGSSNSNLGASSNSMGNQVTHSHAGQQHHHQQQPQQTTKPNPISSFTDLNQPDDLQVSPASIQAAKLIKLL